MVLDTDGTVLLKVYGSRGSLPSPSPDKMIFGGNTACFALETGKRTLMFDCGTGASALGAALMNGRERRLDLFFSHLHLDHILGMPFFSPFFAEDFSIRLWGEAREGDSLPDLISSVMRPPFWPVGLESFRAKMLWNEYQCGDTLDLGEEIWVDTMRSGHPDKCTLFRARTQGKTVVYGLDFEHSPEMSARLIAFARGCDLLIYDAQYTGSEYGTSFGPVGWGHSTWEEGVRIARECGARRLLFAHHAPGRTDAQLLEMEQSAQERFPDCVFAREGEVFAL